MNPLVMLSDRGQSFWYDNIRRRYLKDGTVNRLIVEDGLRGMTSNPSIFEKAIGGSDDYDHQIAKLVLSARDVPGIYEAVVVEDIQQACDLFTSLYRDSDGRDGFVSLEVSPLLAHDSQETIKEAERLFARVNRPNVMIKVPATAAGVEAIKQLIGQGININVTLMFSMAHYEAVAQAYLDGLARFGKDGGDPAKVASVASFFVSRVDSAVDKLLSGMNDPVAASLQGRIAVANSKIVYQRFKEIFYGEAFEPLKSAGARVQRLLWASTSTKNPHYSDTLYVDNLIGQDTVNTMPPATIEAFRDHGRVAATIEEGLQDARLSLSQLRQLGIDLDAVTEQLQVGGVQAFSASFDQLMVTLARKVQMFSINA